MTRLRPPSQPLWYSLMAVVVSTVALGVAGVAYTGAAIEENNTKLCAVIAASLGLDGDPRTPLPTPTTARGQTVIGELRKLYDEYHCASHGSPPIYQQGRANESRSIHQ